MSKSKIKKPGKPVARPVQNRALDEPQRPDPTKRRPGVFSRSILPAFLILHFAFCISAFGSITVTGLLNQITSESLETYITFTPSADILMLTNGLSAGPAKTLYATNGAFSTVLNPGTYLVRLPRVGGRNAFTIGVPHGTGTENITNLIAAPWTYEDFVNTVSTGGGTNGTTYTNSASATQAAGVIVGSSIGTNILGTLTNNTTGNARTATYETGTATNVGSIQRLSPAGGYNDIFSDMADKTPAYDLQVGVARDNNSSALWFSKGVNGVGSNSWGMPLTTPWNCTDLSELMRKSSVKV